MAGRQPPINELMYFNTTYNYNPITGIIVNKQEYGPKNNKIPVGTQVGYLDKSGYRRVKYTLNKKTFRVLSHCLAWYLKTGNWPFDLIDHKDGIKDNNKFSNLRLCSYSQNQANIKPKVTNLLGVKGVRRNGKGYIAQIENFGKVTWSKTYPTIEEAKDWYQKMQLSIHKSFASHLGVEK